MSHEIRTPMNAILGFVQILKNRTSDEKSLSYLDTINSSSELLLHIINDILDYSKIESGKLSVNKHPLDPNHELEELRKLFSVMAKEKSINFITISDSNIPKCLMGDMLRIKQIVFNFLSNALKFSDKNRNVYITLKYNHETQILSVAVRDEGIGISKDAQDKIFNAFEQADGSTTRRFGGTGLGLSISNQLAKLMGGKIEIDSVETQGSTFTLTLPIEPCKEKRRSISTQTNDDQDDKEQQKQYSGNILVAEDNKTNQMLLKVLLEDYGLNYEIANDGIEALSLYKQGNFDLILMDENMPNMTGSESFKKIREYEKEHNMPQKPIVALTANVLKEDQNRFMNMGMNDFLAKPLDTKELERVLDKFI